MGRYSGGNLQVERRRAAGQKTRLYWSFFRISSYWFRWQESVQLWRL